MIKLSVTLLLLLLFGCENVSNNPSVKTTYVEPNIKIMETYSEVFGKYGYEVFAKIQNTNDDKCYFLIRYDMRSLTSIPTPCEDKPK